MNLDALVPGGIGIGGTLLGVIITDQLARLREKRQTQGERKLLAGALAAELKGLLSRWHEICPQDQPQQLGEPITWFAEESYFSVYDVVGHRLYLLPEEIAVDVVTCYVKAKATLDNLRAVSRISEQITEAKIQGSHDRWGRAAGSMKLSNATQIALKYGTSAAECIEKLLPKLEKIAEKDT